MLFVILLAGAISLAVFNFGGWHSSPSENREDSDSISRVRVNEELQEAAQLRSEEEKRNEIEILNAVEEMLNLKALTSLLQLACSEAVKMHFVRTHYRSCS